MALSPASLSGAWALVDCRIRYADGRPDRLPFGPDAQGRLLYTESGHMSAVLSRASRAPLGQALETSARAAPEAKAAAFDGYLSYSGRWRLDGEEVVHTVEQALVPEVVGREQRRHVRLDGAQLVLSYVVSARSGVDRTFVLTWRRL